MSAVAKLLQLLTFFIALCFATTQKAFAAERLVFTQLLHRHGARYPLAKANASDWCPRKGAGCGTLLPEGKDMLVQLGKFIKERYGKDYFDIAPNDYVHHLNFGEIYSRSTAVPRTLQSADGVLRGLFSDDSKTFFPVVNNVDLSTDSLLSADSWPSYALWTAYIKKTGEYQSTLQPLVDSLFPDKSVLVALAAESHFDGYCATQHFSALCVGAIQDLAASLNAQGKLADYPLMRGYFKQLNEVRRGMRTLMFRYAPTQYPLDATRGTVQQLAQTIIANMRAAASKSLPGDAHFYHFSAHDDTTAPFSIAIGDADMLPPFGKMYLIDLVEEDGNYYVRGIQGAPEQSPGPHTYTVAPVALGGIDASGKVYHLASEKDRLPIDDFVRFVDSSKGTSGLGTCYVSSDVIAAMGCDAVDVVPSGDCLSFRSNCPALACPNNTFLRYSDYACLTIDPNLEA